MARIPEEFVYNHHNSVCLTPQIVVLFSHNSGILAPEVAIVRICSNSGFFLVELPNEVFDFALIPENFGLFSVGMVSFFHALVKCVVPSCFFH